MMTCASHRRGCLCCSFGACSLRSNVPAMPELSRRFVSFLACWNLLSLDSSAALGGNNLFGIFRKRRLTLQQVQELRENHAERNGFAGPHGQALTGDQAQELLDRSRGKGSPFKPLGDWIQQRLTTSSRASGRGRSSRSDGSKE